MPVAAPRPCCHPGCGALVRDGTGRCEKHKVKAWSFADKNRGTAAQRGYGAAWVKLRAQILQRDGGLCQPCLAQGRVTPATQVDHKVAKAQGGTDAEVNLQSICKPCHQAKTGRETLGGRGG